MPSPDTSPTTAILTEFDARAWSGVVVLSRDGVDVTLPSYGAGAGVYEDALSFLNGRGAQSGRDLASEVNLGWSIAGALGDITAGIDSADRFYLESDTEDFQVSSAVAALGLSAAGYVGGGAPYRHTATGEWARGNLTLASGAISLVTSTAPLVLAPAVPLRVQDLVTALRASGTLGDIDDAHGADSLEYLDNEASDDISRRIRWGVNSAGHVWCAVPSTVGLDPPTWESTTFRDRLGFSGLEEVTTASGLDIVTADYPLPGALVPQEWGIVTIRPEVREVSHGLELIGGGVASNAVALHHGWDVRAYIDGPAYATDLEDHTVRQFWQYARVGRGCVVYPEWGEPRRNLHRQGVTAEQAAYDLLYCHAARPLGRRGRLRCRIAPQTPAQRTHDYRDNIDARYELRLSLRQRVD